MCFIGGDVKNGKQLTTRCGKHLFFRLEAGNNMRRIADDCNAKARGSRCPDPSLNAANCGGSFAGHWQRLFGRLRRQGGCGSQALHASVRHLRCESNMPLQLNVSCTEYADYAGKPSMSTEATAEAEHTGECCRRVGQV